MRVQRVVLPGSAGESWTVLGDDGVPVDPVERSSDTESAFNPPEFPSSRRVRMVAGTDFPPSDSGQDARSSGLGSSRSSRQDRDMRAQRRAARDPADGIPCTTCRDQPGRFTVRVPAGLSCVERFAWRRV